MRASKPHIVIRPAILADMPATAIIATAVMRSSPGEVCFFGDIATVDYYRYRVEQNQSWLRDPTKGFKVATLGAAIGARVVGYLVWSREDGASNSEREGISRIQRPTGLDTSVVEAFDRQREEWRNTLLGTVGPHLMGLSLAVVGDLQQHGVAKLLCQSLVEEAESTDMPIYAKATHDAGDYYRDLAARNGFRVDRIGDPWRGKSEDGQVRVDLITFVKVAGWTPDEDPDFRDRFAKRFQR